jgi:hypothetical protein
MKTNSILRSLALGTLLLAGADHAGAQGLAMERHVSAGGGGASTGGAFALTGTVGQPDAGAPLSGGAFSLSGGFWALPVAVQMPGAPLLSVSLSNGLVIVSWPWSTNAWRLERTTAFAPEPSSTVWTTVPLPYQTNAARVFITTPPVGAAYYRLQFP